MVCNLFLLETKMNPDLMLQHEKCCLYNVINKTSTMKGSASLCRKIRGNIFIYFTHMKIGLAGVTIIPEAEPSLIIKTASSTDSVSKSMELIMHFRSLLLEMLL